VEKINGEDIMKELKQQYYNEGHYHVSRLDYSRTQKKDQYEWLEPHHYRLFPAIDPLNLYMAARSIADEICDS